MVSRVSPGLFSIIILVLVAYSCRESVSDEPVVLPNLLVAVEGRVEVHRQDQETGQDVQVGFGAELQPGDLLSVYEGQTAIFCGDERFWKMSPITLGPGEAQGVPCVAGLEAAPGPITPLRGDGAIVPAEVPYVLSPRSGKVLSDRPSLRWHALSNVQVYTITLLSDGGIEGHPVIATGVQIPYPDDWKPLRADRSSYLLVVEGGGRRSDEEGTENKGFVRLSAEEAEQLRMQVKQLRDRPVSDQAQGLLLAELYLRYQLHSEAVELLNTVPGGDQIVAIQRLLGKTYLMMDLPSEAESAYQQAFELVEGTGLIEAEATIREGLAQAAYAQGDEEEARTQWCQARVLYARMGMTQRVHYVEELLNDNVEAWCGTNATTPSE